jgi:hypothetical protein
MPTSPSATWSPWAKYAYKPLDMTKIPGSPHKLPKDFKEWLPIFSGEDLITTEDHLDSFLRALEPYDQHEDVWMRLFSYTLVGKAKEWYDSILPGTIMNWDLFQERFTKIFGKNKDYQSLYDQLYNYKRNSGESIRDFNDRFNTLVRSFPQYFKPSQATILKSYMSTMKDPCGVLIGRHPTTLFEAQERACEIEENITSSLMQEEDCLEETFQINQIDDFVLPDPPHNIRTYLQKNERRPLKGKFIA